MNKYKHVRSDPIIALSQKQKCKPYRPVSADRIPNTQISAILLYTKVLHVELPRLKAMTQQQISMTPVCTTCCSGIMLMCFRALRPIECLTALHLLSRTCASSRSRGSSACGELT